MTVRISGFPLTSLDRTKSSLAGNARHAQRHCPIRARAAAAYRRHMSNARDLHLLQALLDHLAEGGDAEVACSPPPHVIGEYLEIRVRIRRDHVVPRLPLAF